ncbi:MAG: hypothetical protein L0Z63_03030 [Actinobacteria bacterium]|nr:hypothetical protein [Actinomycetota bacterium]
MSTQPSVDLPEFPPGYIPGPVNRHLRWNEVEGHLAESLHYWLSTTRPDGRPHVVRGELGERLSAEYARKYSPAYTPGPDSWSGPHAGGLRMMRPIKALAWTSFPSDVTRFTF